MRPAIFGAGLCLALALPGCAPEQPDVDTPPNVVVILIDTLRKDHLHLYGYERRTSDTIDSLGEQGWVFENHIASSGQTVPSTLSMLLSRHPAEHGFHHLGEGHFVRNRPQYPEEFVFLAEVFRDAGYATAGFVGNPFLQRSNGFAQGFDTFAYSADGAEALTEPGVRWLKKRARKPGRPFFLYLHYFDVHWPYDPPSEFRKFAAPPGGRLIYKNGPFPNAHPDDLAATVAMYDAGIAHVDAQVAEIVRNLDALGLRERTLLVVTSDHGDEFLEHGGLGHGTSVYGELVRAPLVLVYPDKLKPGRRIRHLTTHLDLAPTLLDLAGVPRPPQFRGESLTRPAARAFAEDGPWRTVYSANGKAIMNLETGVSELFDAADELDQHPLRDPDRLAILLEHIVWYQNLKRVAGSAALPGGSSAKWSEEEIERLRSLGYVE
jgi:arylsulfatase A-like enzyme